LLASESLPFKSDCETIVTLSTSPVRRAVPRRKLPKWGSGIIAGPAVFFACHALARLLGARFDNSPREVFWQFIPRTELSADPLGSIWFFHAQPPAVNLPFVVTDRLGAAGVLTLEVLLVLTGLATVLLVGDIVRVWTASRRTAVLTAVIAGALPSTTLFGLWLYPTLPIALLLLVTIWGITRGVVLQTRWPLILSAFAITGLFLVRATVIWPLAIAWLGVVAWAAWRQGGARRRTVTIPLATCLAVIVVFTIKNVVLFGSPTQSSWAKENYANVMLNVLTDAEEAALAAQDPCFAELVQVGAFAPVEDYPVCLAEAPHRGPSNRSAVLDESRWQNGRVNYNHRDRLALSERWGDLVAHGVRDSPAAVLRVLAPVQVNGNHEWGSPVLLLGPSTRYVFVRENVAALDTAGVIWMAAFSMLPPIAALAWVIGTLRLLAGRGWRHSAGRAYLAASALVATLSGAYLLLEFGENQRFQVEVLYAWLALGVTAAHWGLRDRTWRGRRSRDGLAEQARRVR